MTGMRRSWPFVPDPDVGSVKSKKTGPRCGRVMHAYEGVWGPLLDDVVCGRPAGHTGSCRSVQSLKRRREYERERWPRMRARRQEKLRLARLPLSDQLAIAVSEASEEARWDALGR